MQAQHHSKEWHEDRRQGLGGSDTAPALGMSRYKTPYQLYLEKIGEAEPEDQTWEMLRGNAMEPALRQFDANETGDEVKVFKKAFIHPKYAFMRYNADGLTDTRLKEYKTAAYGEGWGEEHSDEVPQEYTLQVQKGMFVCSRDVTDVTVSIAGNKPKRFVVEADPELQQIIVERESEFWDRVINRIPPDAVSNDDVAKMYNKVNGKSIEATQEIKEAVFRLRCIKEAIKGTEADKEELEVLLKSFMGENEVLLDVDGFAPLATWKQQQGAKRVDADSLRKLYPDVAIAVTKQGYPVRRLLLK